MGAAAAHRTETLENCLSSAWHVGRSLRAPRRLPAKAARPGRALSWFGARVLQRYASGCLEVQAISAPCCAIRWWQAGAIARGHARPTAASRRSHRWRAEYLPTRAVAAGVPAANRVFEERTGRDPGC